MLVDVHRRSVTGCSSAHNHFSLQQALLVLVLNFGLLNFTLFSQWASGILYDAGLFHLDVVCIIGFDSCGNFGLFQACQ
jgi:hypothetical protein